MINDIWHYPRTKLAEQILGMFEINLSSALVFFAPRRMGKTEFLRKDILPLAEKQDWKVFYFSFLDIGSHPQTAFIKALAQFAEQLSVLKSIKKLLPNIDEITAEAYGIKTGLKLQHAAELKAGVQTIIAELAKKIKYYYC